MAPGASHEGFDGSWTPANGLSHIQDTLGLTPKSLFSHVRWGYFPRRLKKFTGRSHLRVLFGSFFPPKTVNRWLFYSFVRFKGFAKDTLRTASTNKNYFVSKGMVLSSTAVAKPHPSTRQTLTFGHFL